MSAKHQLFSTLKDFNMWDFYSPLDEKLRTINASGMPFIRYPNRVPCFEANMYMLLHLRKGASRAVNGGTLKTYASNISHLIRFCYANRATVPTFSRLTDTMFTLFINGLQAEVDARSGKRVRSTNHVIKIGRQCIDFLVFVRDFYGLKCFIGVENSNAIRIQEKKVSVAIEGREKKKAVYYYHHLALPNPTPEKKRYPISINAIAKLRKAVAEEYDKDIKIRNLCILDSLEQTGARRTEIAMLTVKAVRDALDSDDECPMLRLDTLKRKDKKSYRLLPVPRNYLQNLSQYIRRIRRKVLRKTISAANDHGLVFVSHTNGKPLKPDTITSYMHSWRKLAKIEEDAFAHLFRHLFITEKLKCLILEHDFNNKDEFRKALLNTERFKEQLRQWTGHTHSHSLNIYIDLAFAELSGVKKTHNVVSLSASVKVMKDKLSYLKQEVRSGEGSMTELLLELNESLEAFEDDIDRSLKDD